MKLPIQLKVIVSQPFAENTYVVAAEAEATCLVIDPGLEPDLILDYLDEAHLEPAAILNTHGHSDHIGGNAALKERWPDCPLVIGAGDAEKLTDPRKNLSAGYGMELISPPADRLLREGDVFSAAGIELEVLETPGHSAGHIVLVYKQSEPWLVFGGDVLFQGSIGRSDFPDGDFDQLARSIREKLFTMPDDTIVLPGHGNPTQIGFEKQHGYLRV